MKDMPQLLTSIVPIVGGFYCRYGSMPRFLHEFGVRLALLVSTLSCNIGPELFGSSSDTDQEDMGCGNRLTRNLVIMVWK